MEGGEVQADDASVGSPAPPGERRADRYIVAMLCGAAMVLASVATRGGPGLTVDSIQYMSSGINIAESRGWLLLADQPLTIYAPGLPLIAAFGEVIGIGAEAMLHVLSVASFGAIVLLGHKLLSRSVPLRGVVLGATALLAVSPTLLEVTTMAWSEPPFMVVVLTYLLVLGRVVDRRELGRVDLAALSTLCWIAFFLRYAGVILIVLGVIGLLLALRPLNGRTLVRIGLLGAITSALPMAWVVRNHAVDGTLLGHRSDSNDSLGDSLYRVASTFGTWMLPGSEAGTRSLALVGVAAMLLALVGLIVASSPGPGVQRTALAFGTASGWLLGCAGFVLLYLAYMIAASLYTSFEPLGTRYLFPVSVPGVVVAAAGLSALLRVTTEPRWRVMVAALPLLLIVVHLTAALDDVRTSARDGIGFNTSGYVDSDLAAEAKRLIQSTDDAVVYSNQPFGLWAATRLQPIRWSPRSIGFRGASLEGELDRLVREVGCTSLRTFLIRYRYGDARAMSLAEIRTVIDVTRVAVADDGAIFELTAEEQPRCPADSALPQATKVR